MQDSVQIRRILDSTANMFKKTKTVDQTVRLRCGVDLGTASIIVVVLDEENHPLACEMQPCQVARDGLVVDFMGAKDITRKLVQKLEERLHRKLENAAIAVPPGTHSGDSNTHRYVVEAAGLEVTAVVDEPTAAGRVLDIQNGVVVDIGGGTTGLSVFRDGKVVSVADEATGGTHMSLVLMGRYKIGFEEAEAFKQDVRRHDEVREAVLPVIEKMANIVQRHIAGHDVSEVWLVGGTCCLSGIEDVFARVLELPVYKPSQPMIVTPLGIALNCMPG